MAAKTLTLHLHLLSSHNHHQSLCLPSFLNSHPPSFRPRRTQLIGLQLKQKGKFSIRKPRAWGVNARGGMVMNDYEDEDDDDDDDEEEEEEDRSLDLLIRFVENVFRKVSKKARRAVKSVLPVPISTRLVGFAVNGTLILTFLWVLKAFLQVICTLGSVVFTSILLIRGIWTAISYFQESRIYKTEEDERQSWAGTKPAI